LKIYTGFQKSQALETQVFSKIASVGTYLTSDFGDLKLRDLPKSGFSNELWQNQTLK